MYGHTTASEYDNWVSHTTERIANPTLNQYAPWDAQKIGFGTFVIATSEQLTQWGEVFDLFKSQQWEQAQTLLNQYQFPYHVVKFHDTDSNRDLYMLREVLNYTYQDTTNAGEDENGGFDYSWGLYIYNPQANYPLIITCPHPNDDFISVPVAVEAMQTWNAQWFMIAGAGREVAYNGVYANNNMSLSDPSRNAPHPFNVAYQSACLKIREQFQHRELSVQIHSFDKKSTTPYSCQISAGYQRNNPGMPIRDLSGLHDDIVNQSPQEYTLFTPSGNTITVPIEKFYSIYANPSPVYYAVNPPITVSGNTWYTAPATNQQYLFTAATLPQTDRFEPFFHIEMDEYPSYYPQTDDIYKWFYGYDSESGTWNFDTRFVKAINYYQPWLAAFKQSLVAMFPTTGTPPIVQNIVSTGGYDGHMSISWNNYQCPFFSSYEIIYHTGALTSSSARHINSDQDPTLANMGTNTYTIQGVSADSTYNIAVRVKSTRNVFSNYSNQITSVFYPVEIDNFTAYGETDGVVVQFHASRQMVPRINFTLERALSEDGPFTVISSYQTNPNLVGYSGLPYTRRYKDTLAPAGGAVYYRLSFLNIQDSYTLPDLAVGEKLVVYSLQVKRLSDNSTRTITFGKSLGATNGFDSNFDSAISYVQNSLHWGFYIPEQNNLTDYDTLVVEPFYPNTQEMAISLRGNDSTIPVMRFHLNDAASLPGEAWLVKDGVYTNLKTNDCNYTVPNTNTQAFKLYWGKITPNISLRDNQWRVVSPGNQVWIHWNGTHLPLLKNAVLYAKNGADSLFIHSYPTVGVDSLLWTVPQASGSNWRLYVKAKKDVQDLNPFTGSWTFTIPSSQYTVATNPGWQLVGTPVKNHTNGSEYYGNQAQLFAWNGSAYSTTTAMDTLNGFWLNQPQAYQANITNSQYNMTPVAIPLRQGWNLVPNPHPVNYDISQCSFLYGENEFSWDAVFHQKWVDPACYDYNTGYRQITQIGAGKAFWFYAHEPDISIKFTPFAQQVPLSLPALSRSFWIGAKVNGVESDSVFYYAYEGADSLFNRSLDKIKPPKKPYNSQINLAWTNGNTGMPDRLYQCLAEAPTYIWTYSILERQIRLENTTNQPVVFNSGKNGYPDYLHVFIRNNGVWHDITTGSYTYQPTTAVDTLEVKVIHPLLDNEDQVTVQKPLLRQYPNPFNPNCQFNIQLPNRAKVELDIYNIKGQRVTQLYNGNIEAGSHNIIWDGKNKQGRTVGTGLYLYRVKLNGKEQFHGKMMLLK